MAAGTGGFNKPNTESTTPRVEAKRADVTTTPVALTDISIDMDDFMVESGGEAETSDDIVYLSDEEVEELRSEGFVFEELEENDKVE